MKTLIKEALSNDKTVRFYFGQEDKVYAVKLLSEMRNEPNFIYVRQAGYSASTLVNLRQVSKILIDD